jgi:raffinose/stachyose/melibiose transport system substrate-binding protein
LAGSVLLSACGSSSSSSAAGGSSNASSSAPSGTITVAAPATGGSNLPALFLEAKAFEAANPGIKIKTESFPNQTFYSVLKTQLQGGGGPDVWVGTAGTGDQGSVLTFGQAGLAADLTSQPWASQVPAVAKSQYYSGGKLYAVPMDYVPYAWVYNVTNYKKWGVSTPKTLSEALSICSTAKGKGDIGFAIAGAVPANTGATAMMLAGSDVYSSDPTWDAQRAAGKVTFAGTPGWTKALEDFMSMYKANCFQPGSAGGTFDDLTRYLGSQQAGTVATPTESITTIEAAAHLQLNTYPSFGSTGGQVAFANFGNAIALNAHSSNKAAGEKFLAFLASAQGERIYAQADDNPTYADASGGTIPASLGLSGIAPLLKGDAKVVSWPPASWPNAAVYNALGTGVNGLMTGQTTVPDVLKAMDQAWTSGQSS